MIRIPTAKLKIQGKSIFEIRNQNFCYIQVIAEVKNNNLNVTEVLVSDFKNAFSRIFNFTVGILPMIKEEKLRAKRVGSATRHQ